MAKERRRSHSVVLTPCQVCTLRVEEEDDDDDDERALRGDRAHLRGAKEVRAVRGRQLRAADQVGHRRIRCKRKGRVRARRERERKRDEEEQSAGKGVE